MNPPKRIYKAGDPPQSATSRKVRGHVIFLESVTYLPAPPTRMRRQPTRDGSHSAFCAGRMQLSRLSRLRPAMSAHLSFVDARGGCGSGGINGGVGRTERQDAVQQAAQRDGMYRQRGVPDGEGNEPGSGSLPRAPVIPGQAPQAQGRPLPPRPALSVGYRGAGLGTDEILFALGDGVLLDKLGAAGLARSSSGSDDRR